MNRRLAIAALLVLQALCAAFFLFDVVTSIFGLLDRPLDWQLRELIEIGAAVGLVLGTALGALALRRSEERRRHVEDRLRVASGAFAELLEARFAEWGLTPAERDVALFSIKGLGPAEIAAIRGTSGGTVKAQSAAVYRKAGVSGRGQLLSHFVEELMEGPLVPTAAGAKPPAAAQSSVDA
ncbi:hypothetical protein [Jannaschia sp. W003]|uniref:helix-turn-helix transcriptional regulator n=1 Tax=Jannaschia sp. W003 TaxID=2867012 RepID=UPI0021A2F71E|nr:hypothetical protein [Jannaschia sp. W003]UWQ20869.1 hypothetical protein K3554_12955 [Jannaschia sp. W003]